MARTTIQAPWDATFPHVCARCTAPATQTKKLQRQKPSAQQWFFWFGIIGAAIAGARKGGSLRYDVPYCDDCYRQDRMLLYGIWGTLAFGLATICGMTVFAAQITESSDLLGVLAGVIGIVGLLVLLIAFPVLAFVRGAHQAVVAKRVDERAESISFAFRSQPYFERFWQENAERIISMVLRHGKPLPVPLDEAIAFVGARIDERNPSAPESLSGAFERGQLYLQGGMPDRALADLDAVVGVTGFENPYFLEAQFFRGQAHMQLDHTIEAQADLENYVRASSDRGRVRQANRWLKQLSRG